MAVEFFSPVSGQISLWESDESQAPSPQKKITRMHLTHKASCTSMALPCRDEEVLYRHSPPQVATEHLKWGQRGWGTAFFSLCYFTHFNLYSSLWLGVSVCHPILFQRIYRPPAAHSWNTLVSGPQDPTFNDYTVFTIITYFDLTRTCVISFNPMDNPREEKTVTPFYRCGSWGTERPVTFPKVSCLGHSGRFGTAPQNYLLWELKLLPDSLKPVHRVLWNEAQAPTWGFNGNYL